jgi:hypothetical protein
MITISFEVLDKHAPSFRSAVEEFSNLIGKRLESPAPFAREDALTKAAVCCGKLRAAVNAAIPKGDPHYAS